MFVLCVGTISFIDGLFGAIALLDDHPRASGKCRDVACSRRGHLQPLGAAGIDGESRAHLSLAIRFTTAIRYMTLRGCER